MEQTKAPKKGLSKSAQNALLRYLSRTDRNIGWITESEQLMLRGKTIGIAGTGGMGGLVAMILVRLGLNVKIADNDTFEESNINRQIAANYATLGKNKAQETLKILRALSRDGTKIEVFPTGIHEDTVAAFTDGCDFICDEVEFWAMGSRILLHAAAREKKIPLFNCPTVGHRVYIFRYEHDSMPVEEVLEMTYEEAKTMQEAIQEKRATAQEIERAMELMLRLAAPEIPEYSLNPETYSTVAELKRRLKEEGRASIIATNPPMAAGFLANQILFALLRKHGEHPRVFPQIPSMPGYVMFDAGTLETVAHTKQWWRGNRTDRIVILPAITAEEIRAASAYVRERYAETFFTQPEPTTMYVVAYRGQKIVGTVGIDKDKHPLPAIQYYTAAKNLPPWIHEKNTIQLGRWTKDPQEKTNSLSFRLILQAAILAKDDGKEYAWITLTQPSLRLLKKQGILPMEIEGTIVPENVHPGDRSYYCVEKDPPRRYVISILQTIKALCGK